MVVRAAVITLFAVGAALPADADLEAAAHPGSTGVEWQASHPEMELMLTISGPESFFLRQEEAPGETAQFSLYDEAGGLRPAGSYIYELRPMPRIDDATRTQLKAARESGEEVEPVLEGAHIPATEVQHRTFANRDGTILMGGEMELGVAYRPAHDGPILSPKDIVHADDVIINGGSASLCVGFDCVNGESFDFDTIRMKENNTRIQFDDTSTTTGFATKNWQSRANSSSSGGQSSLVFVDQGLTGTSETGTVLFQVTAGAPDNSGVVDSTGRVGFRTATPALDLQVSTSNTPAMRLDQTSADGFTAQAWDIAGNETNFFVRDVTSGSRLPFPTRPVAPTSSIEISGDGDVGIGTASPDVDLHILATAEAGTDIQLKIEANTDPAFDFKEQDSGVTWRLINNEAVPKIAGVGTGADCAEEFEITQAGNLASTGQLVTGGPQCGTATPCDRVFAPAYEVESIWEHAALMWANSYFSAVGPTEPAAPINLSPIGPAVSSTSSRRPPFTSSSSMSAAPVSRLRSRRSRRACDPAVGAEASSR